MRCFCGCCCSLVVINKNQACDVLQKDYGGAPIVGKLFPLSQCQEGLMYALALKSFPSIDTCRKSFAIQTASFAMEKYMEAELRRAQERQVDCWVQSSWPHRRCEVMKYLHGHV